MKKKKEISKEKFLTYLQSDKGKERHEVEKASLSDPFMQEAMEGFEEFPEPVASIYELDKRIKPSTNWRIAGIAASVLLLFGTMAIWVLSLSSETGVVALENTQKDQPIVSPSGTVSDSLASSLSLSDKSIDETHAIDSDAKIAKEESKEEKPIESINDLADDVESPKQKNLPAPIQGPSDIIENEDNLLSRTEGEFDTIKSERSARVAETTSVSKADINLEKRADHDSYKVKRKESNKSNKKSSSVNAKPMSPSSAQGYALDSVTLKSTSSPELPSLSDQIKDAKELFEKQNYLKSLDLCKRILAENPDQDMGLFYAGVNEKKLGNSQKSILYLEKVPKTSEKYFEARWNLYELLSAEPEKANAILKELASQPNIYQEKAKGLLK